MAIVFDMLRKRGIDLRGAKILEVGSHIGFGLIPIEASNRCFGLEYFIENCKRAKYIADLFNKKTTCFVQGTAAALPFSTGSFDFIQTHHVIEHVPPETWETYISELQRVLKPKGVCLISFPQWHHPLEPHYKLPFLHWLPKKYRPAYARLTPRKDHIASSEQAYEPVMSGKMKLIFTEIPKVRKVKQIVVRNFSRYEDITREFAGHQLIRDSMGRIKYTLAISLSNTWICPERKLLLFK